MTTKPKWDREKAIDTTLELVEAGESLRQATKQAGLSTPTFLRWVSENEALADRYARARDTGNAIQFEGLQEIADEAPPTTASGSTDSGWVAWQKLRIDTAKWILAKKQPRKYGEKLDLTSDGKSVGLAINIDLGDKNAA